jgi:hypothetical protein
LKVWWLDYHPLFNTINFANYEEDNAVREMVEKAIPLSENWKPFDVVLENKEKPSDFLQRVGGALIVSGRAKKVISQLPNVNVEFLPLTSLEGEYYLMNVLTVLNCINPNDSKVKRFSSGRFMDYEEIELYKEMVQDQDVFKIIAHEGDRLLSQIYVSDKLKELIETQLDGYQLIEIWDSEFSWKQKEAKFTTMCEEVDKSLKKTFNFGKALEYVKKNQGKVAYSGKWALKVNEEKDILLGDLQLDGSYFWVNPFYYPPIILGLTWGIKEKNKLLGIF